MRTLSLLLLLAFSTNAALSAPPQPARRPAEATPTPPAKPPSIPMHVEMQGQNATVLGFNTATFGELVQFELPPANVIQWEPDSGRTISIGPHGPEIHLKGRLATGYEMLFDDEWQSLPENRFDIALPIGGETRLYEMRLIDADRHFRIYPMVFFWNRPLPNQPPPPTQRFGFAQLYAGDKATMLVDLDDAKEADLSFRIYLPPGTDSSCERWDLVIENMAGREVVHLFRKGFPPPFIDWRILRERIQAPGEYHYRLQMTYGGKKFESAPSRFHAFAGTHVLEHPYVSRVKLEPRQELGFFTYTNPLGVTYKSSYIAADLGITIRQRWLLRMTGMTEMPGAEPNGVMTFFRFAGGLRLSGYETNTAIGNPFLFQVDALVGYSNFLLGNQPVTSHFGSPSGMLETRFILYSHHRLEPWVEVGSKSPAEFFRFSGGFNYSYYLRTWNLALGGGLAYDRLFAFAAAPNLRFTLMRAMANMTFYL